MFRYIPMLVIGLAFAAGADANAQVKAGLNEINGSAAVQGTKIEGSDTFTFATFTGAYGRFLTDGFEVGPQLSIVKAEGVDAGGTINGFAAVHLAPDSSMVPYVGAQIGRGFGQSTTFTDNPWNFGFFGGLKGFVGSSGAIVVQPFWTRNNVRNSAFDTTTHTDNFGVSVGISLFFGE
jgi:hypothetical protein